MLLSSWVPTCFLNWCSPDAASMRSRHVHVSPRTKSCNLGESWACSVLFEAFLDFPFPCDFYSQRIFVLRQNSKPVDTSLLFVVSSILDPHLENWDFYKCAGLILSLLCFNLYPHITLCSERTKMKWTQEISFIQNTFLRFCMTAGLALV